MTTARPLLRTTIASTLVVSSLAWAAPGDHIRVGDSLELSPTLDLGSEYRTNVYRSEENPVGAANLALGAGLGLVAAGDDHQFDLGGRYELQKFYFVGPQQVGAPRTTGERIGNLDRFDNGNASLGMDLWRRNRVGFTLHDDLALRNTTADAEFADLPYTTQLQNSLDGSVRLSTSSAFAIVPRGTWVYDDFRVPRIAEGGDRSLNERHAYGGGVKLDWRFLPRTALVLDAEGTRHDWDNNVLVNQDDDGEDEELELPNSTFVKVKGGIDGQFTRKIFAKAIIGYGVGLYEGSSEAASRGVSGLDGLLVRFDLRYDLTPSTGDRPGSRIRGGYTKDFRDSFFSNYLSLNALDLEYSGRIGRFEPSAAYTIRFEDYEGELTRSDVVNRFQLGLATPLGTWARLSLTGWWQPRASDMANVEYDDLHFRVLTSFAY